MGLPGWHGGSQRQPWLSLTVAALLHYVVQQRSILLWGLALPPCPGQIFLLLLLLPVAAGYTHVLKTDDDCFVRVCHVLAALHEATPAAARAAAAAGGGGGEPGSHGATPDGGAAGASHPPPPPLQAKVAEWARRQGKPLHSDGMVMYNAEDMVRRAGLLAGEGRGWGLGGMGDVHRLSVLRGWCCGRGGGAGRHGGCPAGSVLWRLPSHPAVLPLPPCRPAPPTSLHRPPADRRCRRPAYLHFSGGHAPWA